MIKILIVEDEINIAGLIQAALDKGMYQWEYAKDGEEAADMLEETDYDLVLLDIMLPVIDGYELLDYIAPLHIPVIFISAKTTIKDRVKGLHLGADDYITKPFNADELLARVESVLRRFQKTNGIIHILDTEIDHFSRTVTQRGQNIELTRKEFDLLMDLVRNKDIALYRETQYERVWGDEYSHNTRTLDLHITRLRKKLGWQDKIKTVNRIGYMLVTKHQGVSKRNIE